VGLGGGGGRGEEEGEEKEWDDIRGEWKSGKNLKEGFETKAIGFSEQKELLDQGKRRESLQN